MFDWSLWLLACAVVFLIGLSKGGFGGGLGALAVPLLTLKIDPRLAAALLLPVLCLMDLVSVYAYRGKWDKTRVWLLVLPALFGIIVGILCFELMSVRFIKLMIGSIALLFVLYQLWGKAVAEARAYQAVKRKNSELSPCKDSEDREVDLACGGVNPLSAIFWGGLSGFSSYVAHAGGPPASIYLLGQHLDKTRFVATTVLTFTIINLVKLVPYSITGLFDSRILLFSLTLLPVAPLGVLAGAYLHKLVSTKIFYLVCYALLFLAGVKLIWDSLI